MSEENKSLYRQVLSGVDTFLACVRNIILPNNTINVDSRLRWIIGREVRAMEPRYQECMELIQEYTDKHNKNTAKHFKESMTINFNTDVREVNICRSFTKDFWRTKTYYSNPVLFAKDSFNVMRYKEFVKLVKPLDVALYFEADNIFNYKFEN